MGLLRHHTIHSDNLFSHKLAVAVNIPLTFSSSFLLTVFDLATDDLNPTFTTTATDD